MSYQKKRTLSCIVVLLFVLLAYICRFIKTDSELIQTLADQCRTCTYLGIYCAWVIYLNKHVVQKKMRQYLTAIGCLMVCWFFLRTVKYHILLDPLGGHICWYLYYIPIIQRLGSGSSVYRTYLLVSVLYTDDPDPNLWIIRHFTDGWSRKEDNKIDHWHPLILLCGIDRLCSYQ